MIKSQDAVEYQTKALADLDTQIAVWNSRLQVLDSQITSTQQAINSSRDQLAKGYSDLITVIEEWLTAVATTPDPNLSPDLVNQIRTLQQAIMSLTQALVTSDSVSLETIEALSDQLVQVSDNLLTNLTQQTEAFSQTLASVSSDLKTHFGITI